jgi:hypothetical protein
VNCKWLSLLLFGLTGLLTGCPGPEPYSDVSVVTAYYPEEFIYAYVPVCRGEEVFLKWQSYNGQIRFSGSPQQNVEPALESFTNLPQSGQIAVTIKDVVEVTATTGGIYYSQLVQTFELIPEAICAGFPVEIRGNYTGILEQVTPQPSTLDYRLRVYWEQYSKTLRASLQGATSSEFDLTCTTLEQEDRLSCVYFSQSGAKLTLEGTLTATGYSGSYQGIIETTTSQFPTSGTFNFTKE